MHDTIRMKEHLPVIRRSGLTAVWMGVEDLTGTLVKKGQSESKTWKPSACCGKAASIPSP